MPYNPKEDIGPALQDAAQQHLEQCWQEYYALEEDPEATIDDVASAPFDGCDTCMAREVLAGAWPLIETYIRDRVAFEVAQINGASHGSFGFHDSDEQIALQLAKAQSTG